MFGMKRLKDGIHYASEMANAGSSDEEVTKKFADSIMSFGKTNFIAGWSIATVGAVVGITTANIATKVFKKIQEKNKNKKLEGSDK